MFLTRKIEIVVVSFVVLLVGIYGTILTIRF